MIRYNLHIYYSVYSFPVPPMLVKMVNGDEMPLEIGTELEDEDRVTWKYKGIGHGINGWVKRNG